MELRTKAYRIFGDQTDVSSQYPVDEDRQGEDMSALEQSAQVVEEREVAGVAGGVRYL